MGCSNRESVQQDPERQIPMGNRHGRTRLSFLTFTPLIGTLFHIVSAMHAQFLYALPFGPGDVEVLIR